MSFVPIVNKLQAFSATSSGSLTLPINGYIRDIIIRNKTANAITGGLKFGTTAGATDVVIALTVGASALTFVTDAAILLRYFSASATQGIFYDAVAAWNSASVDITLVYYQL